MDASERFEVVEIDGTWGCLDNETQKFAPVSNREDAYAIRESCRLGEWSLWSWRNATGAEQAAPSPTVQRFDTGAVRGTDANGTRYDLISPIALEALAETYAEGAAKYGDNNWLKGIPTSDLLNHALRHLNLWQRGDTSEPHLAHAAWNLLAMIHIAFDHEHALLHDRVERAVVDAVDLIRRHLIQLRDVFERTRPDLVVRPYAEASEKGGE